jgi:hypothetical protein
LLNINDFNFVSQCYRIPVGDQFPFTACPKENPSVALTEGRTLPLKTLLRKPAGTGALKARVG